MYSRASFHLPDNSGSNCCLTRVCIRVVEPATSYCLSNENRRSENCVSHCQWLHTWNSVVVCIRAQFSKHLYKIFTNFLSLSKIFPNFFVSFSTDISKILSFPKVFVSLQSFYDLPNIFVRLQLHLADELSVKWLTSLGMSSHPMMAINFINCFKRVNCVSNCWSVVVVWQFTTFTYQQTVEPQREATFEYSFIPNEAFSSRAFGLTVNINYRDSVSALTCVSK